MGTVLYCAVPLCKGRAKHFLLLCVPYLGKWLHEEKCGGQLMIYFAEKHLWEKCYWTRRYRTEQNQCKLTKKFWVPNFCKARFAHSFGWGCSQVSDCLSIHKVFNVGSDFTKLRHCCKEGGQTAPPAPSRPHWTYWLFVGALCMWASESQVRCGGAGFACAAVLELSARGWAQGSG